MSMPRVYIDRPLAPDTSVDLNERQTRYLARALRLRVGDGVVLFDGSGTEYPATLTSIRRNDSVVRTGQGRRRSVESLLDIRLLQAVCKGEKMDMVVQKATELGVSRISPVLTHYGVVKFTADRAASRHIHWQRIAQSACEQCGRNVVPAVDPPVPLEGLFGHISTEDSCKLILLPDAATTAASLDQPGRRFLLLVGPEGGFSPEEVDSARVAGFCPVSLGPRILRTETAPLVAVATIQALWEFGGQPAD